MIRAEKDGDPFGAGHPLRRILWVASLALLAAVAWYALASGASAKRIRTWRPPQHLTWYWQLQGRVQNSHRAMVYDIDGLDNSRAEVDRLHRVGKRVICYVDVGTWENWRSDASRFPNAVLGADNGWSGERWLDVRQLRGLAPIMRARIAICRAKGFDAVEPDNIDAWENSTGFPISARQQIAYDRWVARTAHALGLAVFQKNDPEQAGSLEPSFDGALVEQCSEYSECSVLRPYLASGKPVFDAEYNSSLYPGFCVPDRRRRIMGALYAQALDGSSYKSC